ncbi:MAG: putative motility protein [Lachnospiraceae bacterium]|nr:putative motility protein [Lachnospiraceae bacterium]
MELSGLSMAIANSSLGANISMALMSKVLDTAQEAGDALVEMMETVVPTSPDLGQYIDIRV